MSDRFGIAHYPHPELLGAIDFLAPEVKLLSLIDAELFRSPAACAWQGTASQLESVLTGDRSHCGYEARKLLSWSTACGVYLRRLAKKMAQRVTSDRQERSREWIIRPPG